MTDNEEIIEAIADEYRKRWLESQAALAKFDEPWSMWGRCRVCEGPVDGHTEDCLWSKARELA